MNAHARDALIHDFEDWARTLAEVTPETTRSLADFAAVLAY
jgi:hypothetical protein